MKLWLLLCLYLHVKVGSEDSETKTNTSGKSDTSANYEGINTKMKISEGVYKYFL